MSNDLARAVARALHATIREHGPVTLDLIDHAAERIVAQLADADGLALLGQLLGRRSWAGLSQQERAALASSGGRKAWAGTTPEERSAEMRRRAARRKPRT